MAPVKSFHVGVFLPSPGNAAVGTQLLDTACVDIFGTLSRAYLAPLTALLQDPSVADLAPEVTISYVGAAPAGSLLPLTAGMKIQLTHHFTDADVAPGRLDAVLVPGPDPREEWDPEALAWLAAHAAAEGTDILSVCTGIFVCGKAGLLRGRKACGPRTLQELLGKTFEGVELVGGEMRWVNDGNFWSCGAVTNGNDLVSAYCRESGRFAPPLVELVLAMTEVGDRPQLYNESQKL